MWNAEILLPARVLDIQVENHLTPESVRMQTLILANHRYPHLLNHEQQEQDEGVVVDKQHRVKLSVR
jgi:hypothetical protein